MERLAYHSCDQDGDREARGVLAQPSGWGHSQMFVHRGGKAERGQSAICDTSTKAKSL